MLVPHWPLAAKPIRIEYELIWTRATAPGEARVEGAALRASLREVAHHSARLLVSDTQVRRLKS